MSYIGQQLPADVFSGFTTDAFTGDGSATTFTLSKAPFSEDGLIVVINNVIQRPTTNFTVSGTTLTIVGTAVADGDVIYAIHTSGAVPSTLASKVDVNGLSDGVILDADGDTTISADTDDQIDIKIAGADDFQFTANNFTVASGSSMTGALRPAFYARKDSSAQSVSGSTATKITFNTEEFDTDSKYDASSSRFTPAVAGVYLISASVAITNMPSAGYVQVRAHKNGTIMESFSQFLVNPASGNQDTTSGQITFLETFDDDDYMEIFMYHGDSSSQNTRVLHECRFMAFRVN